MKTLLNSQPVLVADNNNQGKTNGMTLITHPGRAHRDDLVAVSLLLAAYHAEACPLSVIRRTPSQKDLEDGRVLLVDIGGSSDGLRAFDHHQFSAEVPPQCAITLVLKHLEKMEPGLYDQAKAIWKWLTPSEIVDVKGPGALAKELGCSVDAVFALQSPVERFVLDQFSAAVEIPESSSLFQFLLALGKGLLAELREVVARWALLDEQAAVNDGCVFATCTGRNKPMLGVAEWVMKNHPDARVYITLDDRTEGFSLLRRNDHPSVDFRRIKGEPDVGFVHTNGFVAKINAVSTQRIIELLTLSIVD